MNDDIVVKLRLRQGEWSWMGKVSIHVPWEVVPDIKQAILLSGFLGLEFFGVAFLDVLRLVKKEYIGIWTYRGKNWTADCSPSYAIFTRCVRM